MVTKTKKIQYVRDRIIRDDEFAIQCMLAIAAKDDGMRTGTGFRNCDSRIMWSFARQHRERGRLSEKQMEVVKKVMKHYARQLVKRIMDPDWLDAEMSLRSTVAAASGSRIEGDGDLSGWERVRVSCVTRG